MKHKPYHIESDIQLTDSKTSETYQSDDPIQPTGPKIEHEKQQLTAMIQKNEWGWILRYISNTMKMDINTTLFFSNMVNNNRKKCALTSVRF